MSDRRYRAGESIEDICRACKLVFRVEDDIPVMLIEEAKPLEA